MSDAMSAEFDTVAEWTAAVCRRLGRDFYLPAACRGSGSPYALDWFIDRLALAQGGTLLDSGAGVGGPAAYAAQRCGVRAVLIEPEMGACRAAAQLFGFPAIRATGTALPFADQAFDAAWSLGVLCTVSDQLSLLTELRRVVRPAGRIGLLVFVATREISRAQRPEGNTFPTARSLRGLVHRAGLRVSDEQMLAEFADAPKDWEDRADRVDAELHRLYGSHHTWQMARRQARRIHALIAERAIVGTMLSLQAL
jgi:SAM-dependent methyltransferase